MKHRLGVLLTLPLLAACGSASDGSGHGTAPSAQQDPGYRVIALVSGANAGGTPTNALTWLQDDDATSQFAAQFRGDLQAKLHRLFAAPPVPAGEGLFAAVVAVGCDVPPGASAMPGMNGPMVEPSPVASPTASCAAPITTVAVVSGPVP